MLATVATLAVSILVVLFWQSDSRETPSSPGGSTTDKGSAPAARSAATAPFGTQIYVQATDHIAAVEALAVTELNGRPVAVTGSTDMTVRVRDLATGKQIGAPFVHPDVVRTMTVARLDGLPVVISTDRSSGLQAWSLSPPYPPIG
ncbi:hypothetical protein ACFQVD_33745 [Streptosporangium amethystogenes subsp. fukuiense]|uniref:Uncharacterized protein n=1 Tax=Streptosporangium amethystogenes subsp. fukuiense TaxID=698418 RepID=A0ABW2T9K7_9ACTN